MTETTVDDLQLSGNVPVVIDMLNMAVITGQIAVAVSLSIRAETPSGPVALLTSSKDINSRVLSSEHKRESGQG